MTLHSQPAFFDEAGHLRKATPRDEAIKIEQSSIPHEKKETD